MFFVLLNNLLSICIILKNLPVLTTCQKYVLFVIRRVKFYAEWRLIVRKTSNNFTCFSVPKLNYSIIAGRQKFTSVVCKTNIPYCFLVTKICPNALSMCHNIPYLACTIVTCTEQEMTSFWEKSNSLNTLVVANPCVKPLFWDKTIMVFLT